ncbi:MAG: hypothetical protein ACRC14_16315, partial [Paracoccaceae bacterium]
MARGLDQAARNVDCRWIGRLDRVGHGAVPFYWPMEGVGRDRGWGKPTATMVIRRRGGVEDQQVRGAPRAKRPPHAAVIP